MLIALLLAGCAGLPVDPPSLPDSPSTSTAVPVAAATSTPTAAAAFMLAAPSSPAATSFPAVLVPTPTAYPATSRFEVGWSLQKRGIQAYQFGDGPRTIVLVGGIHGGYEANTVLLAEKLIDHFRANPDDVLPSIRLVIIPVVNPDGLARGTGLEARFNANGVDLNRNWGCNWSETAYLGDILIDAGPRPFSEPETRALRAYFLQERPDAVIFYHSAIGAIFSGECGDTHPAALWMGDLLSQATGYPLERFTAYEVSGDASDWLAERNIPAAVIELSTHEAVEFERNLAGVMALQCHFALAEARSTPYNPLVQSMCVPPLR